jgi:hypothetical protein
LDDYVVRLQKKCSTKNGHLFLKTFVLTYLRQKIYPAPIDLHGRGEKGRDIFFFHHLPLNLGELQCVDFLKNDPLR